MGYIQQKIAAMGRMIDNQNAEPRSNAFAEELSVAGLPDGMFNAIEGAAFRATGTVGSGVAIGVLTAFTNTTAALALVNNVAAGTQNPYLIPRYIRLICTAAGGASTSARGAISTDVQAFTTQQTALTLANVNTAITAAPNAIAFCGAISALSVTARKILANFQIKTQAAPCWTVGDELMIVFGDVNANGQALSGASALRLPVSVDPVAIAPGHSMLLHLWNPSNAVTPPSFEFEVSWIEKY